MVLRPLEPVISGGLHFCVPIRTCRSRTGCSQEAKECSLFRRHKESRPHKSKGRAWKNCRCPIWTAGRLSKGNYLKESLDTHNWDVPQRKVRNMETAMFFPTEEQKPAVTVESAIQSFLDDTRARHLTNATLAKLRVLLDQLRTLSNGKGFTQIEQLTTDTVREFRASWKDAPISALKKFERLRSFFRFCWGRSGGWRAYASIAPSSVARIRNAKASTGRITARLRWRANGIGSGGTDALPARAAETTLWIYHVQYTICFSVPQITKRERQEDFNKPFRAS